MPSMRTAILGDKDSYFYERMIPMNDLLIQALLAEYNEADPVFASKPYYYESTSRQARAHLRTLPRTRISLPRLNLTGIVPFAARPAVIQEPVCCPVAGAA
jgi:hypothetical protein